MALLVEDTSHEKLRQRFAEEQTCAALMRYPILSQSMLAAVVNAPSSYLCSAREILLQRGSITALPPAPGRRLSYRYLLSVHYESLRPFHLVNYQKPATTVLGMITERLHLYPLLSPSLLLIALTNVPRFFIEEALREGKERGEIRERSTRTERRIASRYYLQEYETLLLPFFTEQKEQRSKNEGTDSGG